MRFLPRCLGFLAWLGTVPALVAATPAVGDVLSPANAGGMDIHHINTGEGNAALLVLPDQTTWLIDCGANPGERLPRFKAPRRPDESRLPGEWVARYIRKVHPRGPDAPVDYALVTHFHGDHMAGFIELFRHVRIAHLVDRGWPDYGAPLPFGGALAGLYKGALAEQAKQHGMKIERFRGGADQFVLRFDPARYPTFEVRNLAVNGEAWTGDGATMRRRLLSVTQGDENALCAAVRVRYGAFEYFAGGDLTGASERPDAPVWRDMEAAIAWVTGPVDVAVLNHHGNSDSTSPFFLSVLQPRVCIAQVWDAQQLTPKVLGRLRDEKIGPGPRDVFMTNGGWEGRAEHIVRLFGEEVGRRHIEDLKTVVAHQGHVIVRVAPRGSSYHVVVLDDADESLRVRSVHGPYASR
jgi:glyoxylase-like metal-dependent hydrolase (beta-lactamase superfamily II)